MSEALTKILFPVARYSIRHGVPLASLLEALKVIVIEAAVQEIQRHKQKVTVSQISLLSGITRREVQRIYREKRTTDTRPGILARIINRWEQDKRFVTKTKTPKVLSYTGAKNEFRDLVASVSQDINPGTVLAELERTGAVQKTRQGLKLLQRASFVQTSPDKGLNLLLRDLETLTQAVEENINSPRAVRNLHMRTEYDNIFQDKIPEIRTWLLAQGAEFHRQARDLLSKCDKDLNPNPDRPGGAKVALGTFGWTEDQES